MKSSKYQKRLYRQWVKAEDLYLRRIIVKETDIQILTDRPVDATFLRARIQGYRWQIENYIAKEKRFSSSLKPVPI